jgi:hypothetical protein
VVIEREGKKPLVARMGGIPLRHERGGKINDWDPQMYKTTTTELRQRLLADCYELCGSRDDVRVHHIRKLADLKQPGRRPKTTWQITMANRRRKTLVVCHECHVAIHSGRPTRQKDSTTGEPCDAKVSRTVCAVRRVVVNLLQAGRTRKEVLGSPHLPGVERQRGQEHVRKAVDGPRRCSASRRKTRAPG